MGGAGFFMTGISREESLRRGDPVAVQKEACGDHLFLSYSLDSIEVQGERMARVLEAMREFNNLPFPKFLTSKWRPPEGKVGDRRNKKLGRPKGENVWGGSIIGGLLPGS